MWFSSRIQPTEGYKGYKATERHQTDNNLSERQQRAKANKAYSTYSDILYGVPQGLPTTFQYFY